MLININCRVKKYRNEANNGGQPVIFLNAGDTFTGSPLFQIYRDKMVNDFLNTLQPDAVVSKFISFLYYHLCTFKRMFGFQS